MLSADEQDMKNYLEAIRKVRTACGQRPAWMAYDSPEDFVLQHGQWFKTEPLPTGHWIGAPKCCYGNAITAARLFGLRYVEGWATGVVPVEHAWCTDDSGRLYDVTWPTPGLAYLGVQFSTERADDSTWNGDASVLTDPRKEFSVYREPWRGEDWSKPWPESERLKLIDEGGKANGLARYAKM